MKQHLNFPLKMENYKILTYMNENSQIVKGKLVDYSLYDKIQTASILRLLYWLNENILCHSHLGFNLRNKLSNGIKFDDYWNTYLINSFTYWNENLDKRVNNIRRENSSLELCFSPVPFEKQEKEIKSPIFRSTETDFSNIDPIHLYPML